jgi:roadblock/LC7 domain-containing protein
MTTRLDNVMTCEGAIAFSDFGMRGELMTSFDDPSEEHAKLIETMRAANSLMAKVQAMMESKGITKGGDIQGAPIKGWAVSAGNYSFCVIGNAGVLVETAKADLREILRTLGKEVGVL